MITPDTKLSELYHSEDELAHYGVVGMKWGVRKSEYKSMSKTQRKAQRKKHKQTAEYKVKKAVAVGTLVGGPLVGVVAGLVSNKKLNSISSKNVEKGKEYVDKNANNATKTNTQSARDLKGNAKILKDAGVDPYWAPTGKIRLSQTTNKTPYFALDEKGRAAVDREYESKRANLQKRLGAASTKSKKDSIYQELDELEEEYLTIRERDW